MEKAGKHERAGKNGKHSGASKKKGNADEKKGKMRNSKNNPDVTMDGEIVAMTAKSKNGKTVKRHRHPTMNGFLPKSGATTLLIIILVIPGHTQSCTPDLYDVWAYLHGAPLS